MKKYILIICFFLLFINISKTAQSKSYVLKDVYRDAFKIGCAVNQFVLTGFDKASRDIIIRQFNTTTPENVMKAGPIQSPARHL